MPETSSHILTPWSSFYVMTGSSAAALTGLMFVVITLVMNVERLRRTRDGISTFSTPTVAHFGAALFASAILSAPWRSLLQPAIALGLLGLVGLVYVLSVMHRTGRLEGYVADVEDWVCYTFLPFSAYAAIFVGAIILRGNPVNAMFVVAAGILLLIFIGIRNAWDVVTYIAIEGFNQPPSSDG